MALSLPTRRQLLGFAAASVVAAPPLRAQDDRPLRLMVGFAPGGSADQTARLVSDHLGKQLGRPVIVENRTGAGGRIMIEATRNAKPDGSTLMLVPHGGMTLLPHVYTDLRYDPVKDFVPIGRVASFEFALATGPATPAKTLSQYIEWARDATKKASFGSPGPGTVPHLLGQDFSNRTKLNLTHVPYKGAAPSTVDLIGGALSLNIQPLADFVEYHKAGKVTVLATTGTSPTLFVPNVPTLQSAGIDLAVDGWYGVFAPAGIPASTQRALSEALQIATRQAAEGLRRANLLAAPSSPSELSRIQIAESEYWARTISSIGFRSQS